MPYGTLEDLPNRIQKHLPKHAQEIYLAAFNNAWNEYCDTPIQSRDRLAHQVAWAAVKKRYRKSASGDWVSK